jgi:hypothetical protein
MDGPPLRTRLRRLLSRPRHAHARPRLRYLRLQRRMPSFRRMFTSRASEAIVAATSRAHAASTIRLWSAGLWRILQRQGRMQAMPASNLRWTAVHATRRLRTVPWTYAAQRASQRHARPSPMRGGAEDDSYRAIRRVHGGVRAQADDDCIDQLHHLGADHIDVSPALRSHADGVWNNGLDVYDDSDKLHQHHSTSLHPRPAVARRRRRG